jgi:hypothetical protein
MEWHTDDGTADVGAAVAPTIAEENIVAGSGGRL